MNNENNHWVQPLSEMNWMSQVKLLNYKEYKERNEQMENHVSLFPGTAVARNPVTGWERWHGRWTWHSRWRRRSCWAWWATHQSSLLGPGHHTRYTTCGSWLWREHRSTARPMCHSVSGRDRQKRRTRVTGEQKTFKVLISKAPILTCSYFSQVTYKSFFLSETVCRTTSECSWDHNT